MTFERLAATYSPAYNPVLYIISSTYSNVLYFNMNVNDVDTNSRIINDKAYVSPITPTSTHYNISDIARDLVKWQIVNDGTIFAKITDSVRKYEIKSADIGVVGNTMSQLGATASTGNRYVWNGQFPRHKFTDYNMNDWVLSNTSNKIKFLTNTPNYKLVNNYSRDFLYYLKADNYATHSVVFKKFNSNNQYVTQWTLEISSFTSSMIRLDVSPKAISKKYYQDFPDITPQFLDGAASYCVHLINQAGATVSEVKCFKYQPEPDCGHDIVNILWQNSLGGIDSYQFIQPVETRNVERFTIIKNPFAYDEAYNYSDLNQSTYNERERIIHTNQSSNWKMWTRVLSFEENNWIGGIINAKGWWIELTNGRTYPVGLVESTYQVNNNKYLRGERLQANLTFNIVDQLIEDGQIYAGTVSIPTTTTTSTTTTTTTSLTTSTTTTTTTGTSTTTTSTTAALFEFPGSGRGSDTAGACSDAVANNRTFVSNCSTINVGCTIYTNPGGTMILTGYTHIFIDSANWRISPTTGIIQYIDPIQC